MFFCAEDFARAWRARNRSCRSFALAAVSTEEDDSVSAGAFISSDAGVSSATGSAPLACVSSTAAFFSSSVAARVLRFFVGGMM